MILASYVKHIKKCTSLDKQFDSFSEVLDEMRSIRCVKHKGHATHITPFVGKQLEICKALGFDIPDGCDAKYTSRKSKSGKRGRPAKQRTEVEPRVDSTK